MAKINKNLYLQKSANQRKRMYVDIDKPFNWLYKMNAKALKILSKRGF